MSMARSDIEWHGGRPTERAWKVTDSRDAWLLLILSPRTDIRHMRFARAVAALALLTACVRSADAAPSGARESADTVVVYAAASLAVPLRAALAAFSRRTGAVVQQENGASLELARRITELHRVPDVVALADEEVFPQMLVPRVASWYARFARNRMVLAYTDRSTGAASVSAASWHHVLLRPDARVGRSDPARAPVGYRTLAVYRLAERYYRVPGLAARLEAHTPPALIRSNASELVALLQAGELDYIVDYESLARANHLRYVRLPAEIDLGDPAHAADYAGVTVRVARRLDTLTYRGAPITYGIGVPRAAPHREAGVRFLAFLLGPEGRALLAANAVDALREPEFVGDSVPALLRRAHR
jgi:molybdate/tungstate transport system substrate-binding protein